MSFSFLMLYNILKTLCEKVKVDPMSHYVILRLVFLARIGPTHFGGCEYLVSGFQHRGTRKKLV